MCDQHSSVIVKTRKEGKDSWCLRHRTSALADPCRMNSGMADDWCQVVWVEVWHEVSVDECIAPIVDALNKAGVFTLASCCGHGTQPGSIPLRDGREIRVLAAIDQEDTDASGVLAYPGILSDAGLENLRELWENIPRPSDQEDTP